MLKQIVDTNLRGRISPKCLNEFARLADWCLLSHPKQRPMMAEILVCLESVLALQEKSINTLQPAGMTVFGRKIPKLIFPSNRENSVEVRSLKSLDIHLYTVGGENRTLHRFDFDAINVATENFSKLIFRQPFGKNLKGRLQNGQDIAILERCGYFTNYECDMNEASALVKLEHKNLVQLLGYCIAGTKVYFRYNFAPYASLNDLIVGRRTPLDWDERYKILLGVAEALVYLHNHAPIRVIHSDVNLYNILLDESLVPKLSGFWFSRCSKVNEPDDIAVDVIRGTGGFMAPEYILHGCLSTKVDVFNFGFLIFQVATGLGSIHKFVEASQQLGESDLLATISSNISGVDSSSISRFIRIALLCLEKDSKERPSMDEVIGMLLNNSSHSHTLTLPKGPPPSWLMGDFSYNTDSHELEFDPDDYDVGAIEEFKSELSPR